MIYCTLLPACICTFSIVIGIGVNTTWSQAFKSQTKFYGQLVLQVSSGVMVASNIVLIAIIVWIMERSRRTVRSFPPQSTWKRFTRGLKTIIKCSVITFTMWIIHFLEWCFHWFFDDRNGTNATVFEKILQTLYSMQGFILFFAVFIPFVLNHPDTYDTLCDRFNTI